MLFSQPSFPSQSQFVKYKFIPQWSPQAQFAGYYIAYEKGIYKKYGIDLEIIDGGPYKHSTRFLESGAADFATMFLSTAIHNRSNGLDLVNIGQIVHKSALMLVTKRSSLIKNPSDMRGKKVGLWGSEFDIQPLSLFKKLGIDVVIIPQSRSINLFLRGGIDVASAMWYNEYHTILSSGLNEDELKSFYYQDYNLNFPEDGIYTLKSTYDNDPQISCKFVKASIEGWQYSFNNPEESIRIVLKYMKKAHIAANYSHQAWMLNTLKKITTPDNNHYISTKLDQIDYKTVVDELYNLGFIKNRVDYKDFFINCY